MTRKSTNMNLQKTWKRILSFPLEGMNGKTFGIISILYVLSILTAYYFAYTSPNKSWKVLPIPLDIIVIAVGILLFFVAIKIFQKPERGIFVIAFFLPFERIGSLYHYLPINIRISQIMLLVTFFAALYQFLVLKKKVYKLKKDYAVFFLIIFSCVLLLSLTNAADKVRSIEVLLFDLFAFFSYVVLTSLLNTKEILQKTIWVILTISFILGLYSIYQFIGGTIGIPLGFLGLRYGYSNAFFYHIPRVQGTGLEPLYWGNYLLIPLAISFSLLLSSLGEKKIHLTKQTALALGTGMVCLLSIFFSFSRGAWYASSFTLALILFLYFIKRMLTIKAVVLSFLIGISLAIIAILIIIITKAPVTQSLFVNRATAIQDQSGRQINTPKAISLFKTNELLGIGVGGFGTQVKEPTTTNNTKTNEPASPLNENNTQFATVSNQYIEILAETGILGIASFVLFLLVVIFNAFKALFMVKDPYLRTIMIALFAATGGILLQYISFSTIYIMHIWFIFALLSATSYNITHHIWDQKAKRYENKPKAH